MPTREQILYAQMVAADKDIEPFEKVFFFPTPDDAELAGKWLRRPLPSGRMAAGHGTLATALRLVSQRAAVPANYLAIVRSLKNIEHGR